MARHRYGDAGAPSTAMPVLNEPQMLLLGRSLNQDVYEGPVAASLERLGLFKKEHGAYRVTPKGRKVRSAMFDEAIRLHGGLGYLVNKYWGQEIR